MGTKAAAQQVEKGVDPDKALALTAMFCRTTVCLLSDRGYGVNVNGYTPVVTVRPFIASRGFLSMTLNFADQNSALAEQHTLNSMKPFIEHLKPLLVAGLGRLEQPAGTKSLMLEFDPAALMFLYEGIVKNKFPRCETAHLALACIEHKITQ